jgi:hypothetical protein
MFVGEAVGVGFPKLKAQAAVSTDTLTMTPISSATVFLLIESTSV